MPISKSTREKILASGQCECCGATENLTCDHKIPLSKGGHNTLKNLQCLCRDCNQIKGNKLLTIFELRELVARKWKRQSVRIEGIRRLYPVAIKKHKEVLIKKETHIDWKRKQYGIARKAYLRRRKYKHGK